MDFYAPVRAFVLTDRFVDKYLAAQADPDYPTAAIDGEASVNADVDDDDQDENENVQIQSIAQQIAEYEAKPGVADFHARHDLSVREFVLTRDALLLAGALYLEQQHPELFAEDEADSEYEDEDSDEYDDSDEDESDGGGVHIDLSLIVSPANLAIYQRNKDKIHQAMMEIGRRRMQNYKTTSGK